MSRDEFYMSEITLDGFKVVRGQYFSRLSEPCMTIWNSAVQFNAQAYSTLNNCEAVQMMVNLDTRTIIVRPVASREPDAIRWIKDPLHPKTTKLECTTFARSLYAAWGWDNTLRYRITGQLAKYGRGVMLVFDFSQPEIWKGLKVVKDSE